MCLIVSRQEVLTQRLENCPATGVLASLLVEGGVAESPSELLKEVCQKGIPLCGAAVNTMTPLGSGQGLLV